MMASIIFGTFVLVFCIAAYVFYSSLESRMKDMDRRMNAILIATDGTSKHMKTVSLELHDMWVQLDGSRR